MRCECIRLHPYQSLVTRISFVMAASNSSANDSYTSAEISHGIGAKVGIRYPILNGTNYIHWKFRMEYNLRSRKLWTIVSGDRERPSTSPEDKEWEELDEEARQIIVMTVDDRQNAYLFEETTAKGMWDRLKEAYQEESVANTLRLKSAFNSYRKDPSQTMTMHVNKVREMVQELKSVGVTVPKEDVILILLDSLPDEYRMVRSALKSQRDLSVEMVCARLKEEEHDLGLGAAKEEEKAFTASGRRNERGLRCYNCGLLGHTKKFCRKPIGAAAGTQGYGGNLASDKSVLDLSKRKCYNCNKFGHLKRDCKAPKNVSALVAKGVNGDTAYVGISNAEQYEPGWIIDSGATHHMCYEKGVFTLLTPLDVPKRIILGNGHVTQATHVGCVKLELQTGRTTRTGELTNVLFTPEVTKNLFSVSSCIQAGNHVTFSTNEVKIYNGRGDIVAQGSLSHGLWNLAVCNEGKAYTAEANSSVKLWHQRFGHLGINNLKKVHKLVQGMDLIEANELQCDACSEGKQSRNPTTTVSKESAKVLELVHSDVCGPIRPTTLGGNRYFVTFLDDFSRRSWVYLLKEKREVFYKFQEFKAKVEAQSKEKVLTLRSDNGGEYIGKDLQEFCKNNGITHVFSSPYAPNQNGVAERFNRTMIEMVSSMLSDSLLPAYLWGEALHTANYLKNRSPHASVERKTPEEAWSKRKPSVKHLKAFGCKVSVLLTPRRKEKFGSKVWWGSLVGYGGPLVGYRIWNPAKKEVMVRKDVRFYEDELYTPTINGTSNLDEYINLEITYSPNLPPLQQTQEPPME